MRIARWLAALLLLALAAPATVAQSFPSKPVHIIVGVGPGSVSDVRSRWLADRLSPLLGQPVVVENRVGAGGSVAAEYVAKSPADGHILLFATIGTLVIPEVYPNAAFDPVRDFAPVARLSKGYAVLTVNPQLPVRSVADLLKLAREKPGQLNYASTGIGAPPWMAAELFKRLTRIEATHVPYKGGGEVLTDLMGGRLDYWFESPLIQLPHIQAGKLRALAVTGPQRISSMPDVPTLREAGVEGYELQSWIGLVAPAGTPRAAVEKLHAAITKIYASREAIEMLAEQGSEPVIETPEDFGALMKSERARWSPIVRDASVKSQL
jgi:tripartite-type tricarboxylate transporter receptor subunit TctC